MSTFSLWKLFHRPGLRERTNVLAVVAFASATMIFLTVLGGLHGFIWRASPDHSIPCFFVSNACAPGTVEAKQALMTRTSDGSLSYAGEMASMSDTYVILALFACLLLVVPFVSLAGAAARLAASRRDARLAALRLAGATTSQVVRLTAFDAALQALCGAVIGVAGYFAVMPLIMLLNFQNQHFNFEQLWVGPWALILTVVGVALLALVSALTTLRRVSITPLGVSSREGQAAPSRVRLVVFVVAVIGGLALMQNMQLVSNGAMWVMYAVLFGIIIGCFALVNLVGTWAISARARRRVRRPKNAAVMIGMRRILDNPKRSWRNVSGIALAVFIAGITSVCSLFGSAATSDGVDAQSASVVMMRDIGTGGMLTLFFAAVLAAVSSGIMQSASVYDQAQEYRLLVLEGTDEETLRRARFAEVLTPLNTVVVITAALSVFMLVPMFAGSLTNPFVMLTYVGGIALCYALVSVGAAAANRTAHRLNLQEYRADD